MSTICSADQSPPKWYIVYVPNNTIYPIPHSPPKGWKPHPLNQRSIDNNALKKFLEKYNAKPSKTPNPILGTNIVINLQQQPLIFHALASSVIHKGIPILNLQLEHPQFRLHLIDNLPPLTTHISMRPMHVLIELTDKTLTSPISLEHPTFRNFWHQLTFNARRPIAINNHTYYLIKRVDVCFPEFPLLDGCQIRRRIL